MIEHEDDLNGMLPDEILAEIVTLREELRVAADRLEFVSNTLNHNNQKQYAVRVMDWSKQARAAAEGAMSE